MKSKLGIYSIAGILGLLITFDVWAKGNKKNMRRAKSSVTRSSAKGKKRSTVNSISVQSKTETNQKVENGAMTPAPTKNAQPSLFSNTLDMASCDAQYTRCMNKVCASDTMGKCICYEGNSINNKDVEYINVDGIKIKQGFDALNFAKNRCAEILDKCVDDKRLISEKYKNFVQRDCLLLNKADVANNHGLKKDFEELKECMKPACQVMSIEGYENFSYPEYSLCFRDAVANFWMDALCSKIVAKSSAPLMLRKLFLDEMALRRERSCIYMKGTLTNDRKNCRITIGYGTNRDDIRSSKIFNVGEYMECSASNFGTKMEKTAEAKQANINKILSLTATGFNIAGAGLGIVGSADPIGKVVGMGIDIADSAVTLGFDIAKYANGEIKEKDMAMSAINNGLSITLSTISMVGAIGDAAKAAEGVKDAVETVSDVAKGLHTAKTVLDTTSNVLTVGSQVTDMAFDMAEQNMRAKEEEMATVKHAVVDRNANSKSMGEVYDTVTQHGNCFLDKEWFATENEQVMILWKN